MSKTRTLAVRYLISALAFASWMVCHAQLRTGTTPRIAPQAADTRADYIVAVVNSEPITYRDVLRQIIRLEQQLTRQGGALPSREEMAKQVLEKLIDDRALVQEARDLGIKIDDTSLDESISDIAKQNNLTVAQLYKQLDSEGIDKQRFRQDIRDEMLVNRLREREFEARIRIPDAEVEEYIREQGAAEGSSLDINLAQILVEIPENATDEAVAALRSKAEAIKNALAAGADMESLLRDPSPNSPKIAGGTMGLRSVNRYPEAFVRAVADLPTGGISEIIRTGAGFHVLKLIEKQQAGLPSTTIVQTRSRHILIQPQPHRSNSDAASLLASIRDRIAKGDSSFEEMARQYSADGSAETGGDLGWTSPGQFVPEFESVMNRLPIGGISQPFVSRYGVHIVQVQSRREQKVTEADYRNMVRQALRDKRIQERFPQWVRDIRANAYVEYRQAPEL